MQHSCGNSSRGQLCLQSRGNDGLCVLDLKLIRGLNIGFIQISCLPCFTNLWRNSTCIETTADSLSALHAGLSGPLRWNTMSSLQSLTIASDLSPSCFHLRTTSHQWPAIPSSLSCDTKHRSCTWNGCLFEDLAVSPLVLFAVDSDRLVPGPLILQELLVLGLIGVKLGEFRSFPNQEQRRRREELHYRAP